MNDTTDRRDDDGELVGQFEKNGSEVIRVRFTTYQGHDLIDIRTFYQTSDGAWKPGRQGIQMRRTLIPDLLHALMDAANQEAGNEQA